jgi:hypothetical protein
MLCNTTQGLSWITFLTSETHYSSESRSLAYTYGMTNGKIQLKKKYYIACYCPGIRDLNPHSCGTGSWLLPQG